MDVIHIVGAGGIGCAVGYALRSAGLHVHFIETNSAKLAAGKSDGVVVAGRPALPAPFISFADWVPQREDLVLLCTKCYDNAAVLAKLPSGIRVLPIQNGFDPQLEQLDHAAEGISSFVSECEPDRPFTRITRRGALHLGPRGGATPAWLHMLVEPLRRANLFRVIETPDVRPYKYAKLMYNAAISPLAAAAGLDNGELLHRTDARRLFFALLRENHDILVHANKPLGKVGPFHPRTVMRILDRPWLARPLAIAFRPSLCGTYCSMAGDIERGQTEIAYYNGRLVEWANGTACPLNRRAVAMIERMQRERMQPHVGALAWFDKPNNSPVSIVGIA